MTLIVRLCMGSENLPSETKQVAPAIHILGDGHGGGPVWLAAPKTSCLTAVSR